MNLREQEFVLAIARHGNLKSASEYLNISQPGLSIFLSTLEKNSGAKFFHRVGKKFVPTDAGSLYIETAKRMAESKTLYESVLSDIIKGVTGTVSVGMHPRRTTFMLPAAMKKLAELYPDVQVGVLEGSTREILDALTDGELDLAVLNCPNPGGSLEFEWFYDDRLVAVLSPSHPAALAGRAVSGESLEWLDLSLLDGGTFILQRPDQAARRYTDEAVKFSGARPGRVITVENLETASQMAAEGLGVAFNLRSYTRSFVYPKPVNYFLAGDLRSKVVYSIARRRDRYKPKYVDAFIAALRDVMSEERGGNKALTT
jgi:DNA-binding transcriptional LysR family regulator